MHTVIRTWKAAPEFANGLKQRSNEIERLISGVPGFVAYYFIATAEGGTSVTVCEARAGCDESTKLAGEWVSKHMPDLKLAPPQVIAGEVAFKFARNPAKV